MAKRRLARLAYIWHRRIGLAVIPVIALLVVTGIAINHTSGIGLDRRHVSADWLLAWYGIEPATDAFAYAVADSEVGWLDGRLFLDGVLVADNVSDLVGAVAAAGMVIAASREELYLLTPEGQLIEKATATGLPGAMEALAPVAMTDIAVRSGGRRFVSDADELMTWAEVADGAAWPRPRAPRPTFAMAMRAAVVGDGLTWERVLLDLHSGRFFGRTGPLIIDAVAVLLLILAASGFYNRIRHR
jgi:hypothetical protein